MVKARTASVLLLISLLGFAACGGGDGDATATSAEGSGEPILIKTHLDPLNAKGQTTGEVRSGSTVGDSAFCVGGNFLDGPVEPPQRKVVRTFRCPGGILTISFVSTPPDVKQRSDWEVVDGFGRFEGLRGGGRMTGELEAGSGEGRETFTGTVTR
jgi:hypothetical protein